MAAGSPFVAGRPPDTRPETESRVRKPWVSRRRSGHGPGPGLPAARLRAAGRKARTPRRPVPSARLESRRQDSTCFRGGLQAVPSAGVPGPESVVLSNAARGNRRKALAQDAPLPTVLEPVAPGQGRGKNSAWTRVIQKVYEVDPLQCPECGGRLKVISFITDPEVIRRILEHLGLWLANARPVPRAPSPPPASQGRPDPSFRQRPPAYGDDFSQLPPAQWDF